MNWALSSLLAVGMPQSEFLQNLYEKKETPCLGCATGASIQERQEGGSLMIFISFSVPLESWKDLSAQLQETEGFFVLKGIPNDSFETFREKLLELRTRGVHAPIDIDADRFERYGIESVPSIVLEDGSRWDKIDGNIRLDAALREMAEKGDTEKRAKEILQRLDGQR